MATAPPQVNRFGEVNSVFEREVFFALEPDCAAKHPVEESADLNARFVRDAVPLLEKLYGHAARLTGNRADAEDLVQQTGLLAYANFRTFRPGTNLKAWLYRIMSNARINTYRRAQRRPLENLTGDFTDGQLFASGRHASMSSRSAEAEALGSLFDDKIADALAALPEKLRMVLHYAYVDCLRYQEIADVMDTPVGTLMSRLYRARRQLHVLLADIACERGFTRRPALADQPKQP